MAQGLQFWTGGWSGSITIDDGTDTATVTPQAVASPLQTMIDLAAAASTQLTGLFSVAVTSANLIELSSTGSLSWSLTFTGNCDTQTGFTGTYSSVETATAAAIAPGGFYPYSDNLGLLYARDIQIPNNQGVQTYDGATWYNTPATNLHQPLVRLAVLRSQTLSFVEKTQLMSTPAKVDIVDNGDNRSFYVGNIKTQEANAVDGWTNIEMDLVR